MKTNVWLVIGIFLLALSGAGLALAQQPPQQPPQPPQEPPQEQPAQAQPVVQLSLTVEEAVMCTGVMDRTPQGVPSLTAPAAAAGTTTPAAAAAPQAATAATAASTAAESGGGGGGDPFPFAVGVGKLYCFTKISGATVATTIKHVWYFGDKVVHTMDLSLDGSPWRTWSNKTIPSDWTGTGKVEIQDANGTLLKTVNFIVQ